MGIRKNVYSFVETNSVSADLDAMLQFPASPHSSWQKTSSLKTLCGVNNVLTLYIYRRQIAARRKLRPLPHVDSTRTRRMPPDLYKARSFEWHSLRRARVFSEPG